MIERETGWKRGRVRWKDSHFRRKREPQREKEKERQR